MSKGSKQDHKNLLPLKSIHQQTTFISCVSRTKKKKKKKKKKKVHRRDSISRTKIQQKVLVNFSVFKPLLGAFFLTRTSHTLMLGHSCIQRLTMRRKSLEAYLKCRQCVCGVCVSWYVEALLFNLCMCMPLGARDTCKFNLYKLYFVVVQY